MDTPQAGISKTSKAHSRFWTYFLGILMLGVLLIIPLSISYAHGAGRSGIIKSYSSEFSDSLLIHTNQLTDTVTATATITLTATTPPTPTDTSAVTPTLTETSTTSPTATDTSTTTPTATGTATSTSTSTATPTVTGTQPTKTATPTVTGTLTTIPSLKVVVQPAEAKINENFTFAIEVGNNGTGPTRNNMVLDYFPTYIDVLTVTPSRGTITKLAHSFVVTLGDIYPGEKITIAAGVKVNSTLNRTETVANVVTLTYDISKSVTASVNYKVVYLTLPPTGELPLNWQDTRLIPVAIIPGILLMGLGAGLLLFGIWSKVSNKHNSLWTITIGTLLVIIGFIAGTTASGMLTSNQQSKDIKTSPTSDGILAQIQLVEPSQTKLPRLPASAFSTPEAIVPIVTLPNYPIPTPELTLTPQPGDPEPDISPVVRIVIPGISLDTEVKYVPYDGNSWMISGLRQEVARSEEHTS